MVATWATSALKAKPVLWGQWYWNEYLQLSYIAIVDRRFKTTGQILGGTRVLLFFLFQLLSILKETDNKSLS